jgi:hypothetical protein
LYRGPTATSYQRGALTKKKRTIRNAVMQIELWRLYIDNVKRDKRFLAMWDYLYPFFKKNTGEGYYPLSRNICRCRVSEAVFLSVFERVRDMLLL